jgi:hypothetical protein
MFSDLTLFDVGDNLESNPFEERWDDEDQYNIDLNHARDPLTVSSGPIRIAKVKELKEVLNGLA